MNTQTKDIFVTKLHKRTHLSENFLNRFSQQDLHGYFNRVAHPALHAGTGMVYRGFLYGAVVGYFNNIFNLQATIGFAAFALTMQYWNKRLTKNKNRVIEDMTEQAAQAFKTPPGPLPR